MTGVPQLSLSPATDSAKLRKMVQVLMEQVERGIDFQGNAYSLFQTAIVLEDKIRERTRRLETTLRELEKSHRELSIAKQQTETAQTRLMEAVESISEGFVQFDSDDHLIFCNTKFLEQWSGSSGDIREIVRPGVSFRDISRWTVETGLIADVSDDPEEWLRGRLYRHSNPTDPIVVHLTSGRWLQVRERQTKDGGIVGIYTDITRIKLREERRREIELAEKSMLLQSTLDSLPQGVSVFDRHLRLVAWNDRFLELLELPDWLVRRGASYSDYLRYRAERGDFDEGIDVSVAIRLQQALRREAAKREQILQNGTVLEVRRDPMPGGGFVTTYTDITERQLAAAQLREAKEGLERRVAERTSELTALNGKLRQEIFERAAVEEQLRLAKAQAEHADMSKTRFLAAASHDLLQPLNAARLFVCALSERELAGKERDFVVQIERALGSVETLLGTLLDISKLDAGAVSAQKVDFVIGDLLQMLAEEYGPVAREAGLELVVVPSSHVVRTDVALLGRVLRNFLSNAIRYTPGGRILLGCRRRGWSLRIETWDTGIGIPEDRTEEVFEEFRQLDRRDRQRGHSCGLGLAIVRRIARILDHRVGVRSQLGKGSMFSIEVPIGVRPSPLNFRELAHVPSPDTLPGAFAVVIDDEEHILDGMRCLLEGWGCDVLTAVDGRTAALALAREGRTPDVIIADYHLGDGSTGLAAIHELRDTCAAAVPAVVVTADRSPNVHGLIRRSGIHVLKKPLKPAKLRALVSHLLVRRPPTEAGVEAAQG